MRDKDGVNASLLIAEAACYYSTQGKTLCDVMAEIFQRYGYYLEHVESTTLPGIDGLKVMAEIMARIRKNPPVEIGGVKVARVLDIMAGTETDVATGKVFRIYRWSGSRHADCVPATAADTKVMCDIVGFPYNSNHPNSSQLAQIKADGDSDVVNYTWPDFKNKFGGATNIGSAWDRRAALLNVNGTVYPVSIYGFPHGFNGTDSFSQSRFSNGQYFYAVNNYYLSLIHISEPTRH